MLTYKSHWQSPIGLLGTETSEKGLRSLSIVNKEVDQMNVHAEGLKVISQLEEYFQNKRTTFGLPLDPQGTDFQHEVWNATATIPYGETRTYADIAHMIGRPSAARAVGQALNCNPIMIIVPCHRVVSSSGSPGGFAWGESCKQSLLSLESAQTPS